MVYDKTARTNIEISNIQYFLSSTHLTLEQLKRHLKKNFFS